MAKTSGLEKVLVIDNKYLSNLHTSHNSDWTKVLTKELAKVYSGQVQLHHPKNSDISPSFYSDVRSFIYAKSIEGNYSVKLFNKIDVDKMRAVLGYRNVSGDYTSGYRFKFG